ncbi:E3 ubiquitin ligase complex SCF subunit sconC [Ditylenchus destructor]|uniref:E3 ubiquitin ligase complex SCF subunit sconC n=1 Tax=Ditylenchus destructor TaxID=166010 RepID=A0AAD4NFY8_9BILA|nr:E3 ubiquitin ligase complex SCF subunit sconC [Ditylenchus destructor]
MKKAIELPLSTQPESESPYFIVEGTKIGIPEHFHRYSELVANFSSANPESIEIKLPTEYKCEQLELIIDFFYELKEHPVIEVEEDREYNDENVVEFLASLDLEDEFDEEETTQDEQEPEEEHEVNGAIIESDTEEIPEERPLEPFVNKMQDNKIQRFSYPGMSQLDYKFKLAKLPHWSQQYFSKVDKQLLFLATNLANYLNAGAFLEHACYYIANKIRDMRVTDIREYLGTQNPCFVPGEFDLLACEESWREPLIDAGLVDPNVISRENDDSASKFLTMDNRKIS